MRWSAPARCAAAPSCWCGTGDARWRTASTADSRRLRRVTRVARRTQDPELRTATSYTGWLGRHGRAAEGRALLAPIYATFTEGFDTRDLIEAMALLQDLG